MTPSPPERTGPAVWIASAAPWTGIAALWAWSGNAPVWTLGIALIGLAITLLFLPRDFGRARAAGAAVLVVAILVAFHAERQVNTVLDDWDTYWAGQVDVVDGLLRQEIEVQRVEAGAAVADALLQSWLAGDELPDQRALTELRDEDRIAAIAFYDPDGTPRVWNGVHRGKIPEGVQRGDFQWSYRDLPLFGYFYVTARADDGRVVMVAYLLRASLPDGLEADMRNLARNFYRESGERIRVTEEDPGPQQQVWEIDLEADRLLSVWLEQPDPAERAEVIRRTWAGRVAWITLFAWVILAVGGRPTRNEAVLAMLALTAGAVWVPVDSLELWASVFSGEGFLLPGPVGLAVGRAAMVSVCLFGVASVLPRVGPAVHPLLIGGVATLTYPAVIAWVSGGLESGFLAAGRPEWIAFVLTVLGPPAVLTGLLFRQLPRRETSALAIPGSIVIATILAGLAAASVVATGQANFAWAAAWGLPVALAAFGLRTFGGWRRTALCWSLSLGLAGSALIPLSWGLAVDARLDVGEATLAGLAAVEDVELEDRLMDFARLADSLDAAGAEDVAILYDGWRLSGLADLGAPIRLQIELRDGSPGEGLRVAVAEGEPQPYQDHIRQGRESGGVRLWQLDRDDARYILTAALPEGRIIGAVVPPFPDMSARAGIGPLVRGLVGDDTEALRVIPLPAGRSAPGEVERSRTRTGWQVDVGLRYSTGPDYHALYAVDLPGLPLTIARGVLVLVAGLLLGLALVALGHVLVREPRPGPMRLSGLVISFRARVTLALFGFFALANAIFGTVAFRTLNEASRRSTQVIAQRVVDDAAGWYRALDGQMERLANQVGAELLEYRDGELQEGSVEELVELGLYEGWTPYSVHQELDGYDQVRALHETSVGRWEYVTAYRLLTDGDVLAAQVPLQAGTSALRTTDLLELLSFVVLLGGVLSLGLAMIAGRALTRPIQALQIASESVGSGDLGLRLPAHRQDEFGAVFRAFNRMVGRVRRARRQLVRTSRRTQLIMDEAAVGMVALDPDGSVLLVNPRAEELLGIEVEVSRPLPSGGALGEALSTWVQEYLEGSAEEANSDFQTGERRVRVRARRLGTVGTRRGAVVALDDVTDELKAERVLAWGEMARQVAHEVKNPLTPIKLSIQHVRRAWDDEHPDFDSILVRNADAMLAEIDRLAEIAQSFSRFGAPGGQPAPLAPVFLGDVVGEVMALYGGAASRVRFEQAIEAGLPPVVARTAELKEVLVNLLENARLAGTDGTLVTITARRGEEGRVLLMVRDDGAGIPPDVLPRIFEPQFSTRSRGTGLGLAIVQRVVTAWGGHVTVESSVGEGTTVSVELREWEGPDGASGDA